jgi:hypothetical protein
VSHSENVRAALSASSRERPTVEAICVAAGGLLGADHVALSFLTDSGPWLADGSDPVAARLDALQVLAGDGPLLTGIIGDIPLVAADLVEATRRWPSLAETLASSPFDVGSVIVIPLRSGTARLGALTAYIHEAGETSADVYATAAALSTAVTEMLLAGEESFVPSVSGLGSPIVQQAVGMLAERHGVTVSEAQVRLRAMAFGRSEPIEETSGRIVRREDRGGEQ